MTWRRGTAAERRIRIMSENLVNIFDLSREKRIPLEAIEELINAKLLSATPDGFWVTRSSVEALERFLEAVKEFQDYLAGR
jgi:hypothetical protein